MKYRLILFLASLAVFLGCKEDEKVDENSYFFVNGERVTLHQGFLFDYGSNPDLISRDYDIVLTTNGITYDSENHIMKGIGSFIFFDLQVNSTERFEPGTFTWAELKAPNTMIDGFAGITCSFSSEVCEYQSYADGGTVTVEVSGESYILNFNITLRDGQTAEGYYKGPITAF